MEKETKNLVLAAYDQGYMDAANAAVGRIEAVKRELENLISRAVAYQEYECLVYIRQILRRLK